MNKQVIIKKTMTNKLKKQLKQLKEEYEIKQKIITKLHSVLDKLDLLWYMHNEKPWDYVNRCRVDRWVKRYYWFGQEFSSHLNKEYNNKRQALLCIKTHRIYRYGKNNCWIEYTQKQLKRIERRHQSKQKYIARLYEQGMQA